MSKKHLAFAEDFFKKVFALDPKDRMTLAEMM